MLNASLNVPHLLSFAFNRAELAYLNAQPGFAPAVLRSATPDDLDDVCLMAETLLEKRERSIPEAPSLRTRADPEPIGSRQHSVEGA